MVELEISGQADPLSGIESAIDKQAGRRGLADVLASPTGVKMQVIPPGTNLEFMVIILSDSINST